MLSKTTIACLNVLLNEDKVLENIKIEGDVPRSWRIMDNGSVRFSRFRYYWMSYLLGGFQTITFNDLIIKLINTFSGVGKAKNKMILEGLKTEYLKTAFDGDKESVIGALLTIYLVGFGDKGVGSYLTKEDFENSGIPIWLHGRDGYKQYIVPLSQLRGMQ